MLYGIGYSKISHAQSLFIVFLISWFFIPYFNGNFLLRPPAEGIIVYCIQYNFTTTVKEEMIGYRITESSYVGKGSPPLELVKLNVTEFTKEIICEGSNTNISYSYRKKVIVSEENERDNFNQVGLAVRWDYAGATFLPGDPSCPKDEHFLSPVPCDTTPTTHYVWRYTLGPLFATMFSMVFHIGLLFIKPICGLQLIYDDTEEEYGETEETEAKVDIIGEAVMDLRNLLKNISDSGGDTTSIVLSLQQWLTKRCDMNDKVQYLCDDLVQYIEDNHIQIPMDNNENQ